MPIDLEQPSEVTDLAARTADFVRDVVLPVERECGGIIGSDGARRELQAAAKSWFTPTSTKWSDVDNAKTLMDMLQSIASGHATVADATKQADKTIDQMLSAG